MELRKRLLADQLGCSRFRQRLFLLNGDDELPDDMLVGPDLSHRLQLVILNYSVPDSPEPLLRACAKNRLEEVERLLQEPLDPDGGAAPPIHVAAHEGHTEVVRLLLEARADMNLEHETGVTAMYVAAQNGHLEVLHLLKESGADCNQAEPGSGAPPMAIAAQGGHLEVTKFLFKAGAHLGEAQKAVFGAMALHGAAHQGHKDVVQFLLDSGVATASARADGTTALQAAAKEGHLQVVQMLLDARADSNEANRAGKMALHFAAEHGQLKVAALLLQSNANINAATQIGTTALLIAAENANVDVFRLLLDAGAEKPAEAPPCLAHPQVQRGHWATAQLLQMIGEGVFGAKPNVEQSGQKRDHE